MKDYDENEAIEAMIATLAADRRNEEVVFEILDLIYSFYEENGDLDINMDDEDDDEPDMAEIVAYISKQLRRHRAAVDFSEEEIEAMVKAEYGYQESLL